MTKEEFQKWAQSWSSRYVGSSEGRLNNLEEVRQFDPQAATLVRMVIAAEDALKGYLKTRIDNH